MKTISRRPSISALKHLKNNKAPLPKAFLNAIGILKGKKIDPLKYQKTIRQEWERRLKKQIRLGTRNTRK
ncbi:MAG: hypothetical protein COV10_04520 [Candidatus Vogelbacteria bacterium CG10_big_fil_rev_8_21_14_0_10_51_16]|uniref:Uncharacterized protein n=1 Tax=Candidatus Vogelbacteria bacterium CG10_big_fil_rev_8_21_14_0_10_51_16 TaxID=1975045 RepID=A0A2H0RDH4_9BACT|nr:MAG: hypothetical protein COV10_04520 [Candidatus Vogelbacteria bacterium CG10_big_fil_rev_8_21_14_0_10_51_16]